MDTARKFHGSPIFLDLKLTTVQVKFRARIFGRSKVAPLFIAYTPIKNDILIQQYFIKDVAEINSFVPNEPIQLPVRALYVTIKCYR